MMDDIRCMINNGLPTLATCAGLILLARHIAYDDTVHIGTLPVTVKRNAYGRQLSSFVTNADIKHIGNYPMTFIRAPYINSVSEGVEVLASVDDKIEMCIRDRKKSAVGVRGIKLGKDDYIEEIFLMDDGTEFTMEYKGKNIDFAKMKMAHRDTKGVKVRV